MQHYSHYSIRHSSDKSVIGSQYPQIQKMKNGYAYKGEHSVYRLSSYHSQLPDFMPDLDGFILSGKSKLTDFLSNVFSYPNGYLVSKKVKNILTHFSLPTHAFYPIVIYNSNKIIYDYYWYHAVCDLTEFVDYPSSHFYIRNFGRNLGEITIWSKEDFLIKLKYIKEIHSGINVSISCKSVKLLKEVKYDFFDVGFFDPNHYISSNLKEYLEKENVNGIVIDPLLVPLYHE